MKSAALLLRSFWSQWLLHWLVLWLIITLGDSGIGWYNGNPHPWSHFQQMLFNLPEAATWAVIVLLVEALYHTVFRRFGLWVFSGSVSVAVIVLEWLAMIWNGQRFGHAAPFLLTPVILVTIYAVGYALLRNFFAQRYREAASRAAQSETELAALRAHLNPHFFFNTINTLYGTALEEGAPRTAECIERLANLMRYTLRDVPNDIVPVAEEIQFVRDYLALQQLRLPVRPMPDLRIDIVYDGRAATIAPLLLLPFLENAFAYGISVDTPCFLHLTLHVNDGQLTMQLVNRVLPQGNRRPGAGTGLRNVRQRLVLLYPSRHTLHLEETADTFTVQLYLHLDNAPPVNKAVKADGNAAT